MPSDASGNYALDAGYLAVAGATIQPSQHNPALEDVAAALTARLMRSGAGGMTGQLKAISGTVAAPGYSFATALNSGFYKTTNGIGVSIGGVLVAEFGAGGLLSGVGTAGIADKAVTLAKFYHPTAAARLLGTNGNAALTITGAANNGSGLVRLTVASSATFATGQSKTVSDVLGTTEANGTFIITVVDATHIDLQGSAFVNAYVSGGTIGGGVDEIKLGSGLQLIGDTASATVNPTLLPNYLSGLTLSAAGSSATFGISAGAANDSSNADLMLLASAYTKTTSAWAVGTGNGALDTGAIAINTWYHVHEIKRPDTSVVDVCVSLNAAAPTLGVNIPAAYTRNRRVGSLKTDGAGQWIKFTQTADNFIWAAPVNDVNGIASTTARVNTALSVPTGLVVSALFRGTNANGGAAAITLFASLQENDVAPTNANNDLYVVVGGTASVNCERLTDTSGQIGVRSNATTGVISITTYGWKDTRGK